MVDIINRKDYKKIYIPEVSGLSPLVNTTL